MTKETPIAWTALEAGTPVRSSDGDELGKVLVVVADKQQDIFSGIAFRPGLLDEQRFAPANIVAAITTEMVTLSITAAEAGALENYEG